MWSARNRQAVLLDAFVAWERASSYHAVAQLDLRLPFYLGRRERPIQQVTARVDGDVLKTDGQPEVTGKLSLVAKGRGTVFSAAGDLRLLQDSVLFNLQTLPVLLNPRGNLINRWTAVAATPLHVSQSEALRTELAELLARAEYEGRERRGDERLYRFKVPIGPDEKTRIVALTQQTASGSSALHIVARLAEAFDIGSFTVWVAPRGHELRRIEIDFVKPQAEGDPQRRARLLLAFDQYGKAVTIDRPAAPLSVRPDVFARMFGSGEIEVPQP